MFRFPQNLTNRELADEVLSGEREAVLLGRYPFGERYLAKLLELGVRVEACYDSAYCANPEKHTLLGVNVYPLELLPDDGEVVIICGNGHYDELEQAALQRGITDLLPYYFIYDGKEFNAEEYQDLYQIANVAKTHWIRRLRPGTAIINSLELAITHRCTLNCEKCANMISYFTHPRDANLEKMKDSVARILDADVYVSELRILGGEPFLNPELGEYLQFLLAYDNIGLISIMTNATILPHGTILSLLSNPRVYITLSDYGALSRNMRALLEAFREYHVLYRLYAMDGWRDCNTIEYKAMTPEDLSEKFLSCSVNHCWTIYNGYLFHCPYNAGVTILHAIPEETVDAVNLLKIGPDDILDVIFNFEHTRMSKVCAYCKGRPKAVVDIEAAKQISYKHAYDRYIYKEEQYL